MLNLNKIPEGTLEVQWGTPDQSTVFELPYSERGADLFRALIADALKTYRERERRAADV